MLSDIISARRKKKWRYPKIINITQNITTPKNILKQEQKKGNMHGNTKISRIYEKPLLSFCFEKKKYEHQTKLF